ncbi:MAG: ABC transporter permease, partial [Clostridia bacterium]|nr:ABC transporter permease [Clostridia bacterium]
MNRSSFRTRIAGSPYLVWAALFILVPLGMVAYYSFTDQNGRFTLDNMARISDYTGPFLLSIWLGLLATVICLIIAYPLAYLIANSGEKRQRTMMLLMMLPMWMNFLLRTYSWMTILGDNGLINTLVTAIGLDPLKLINTRGAVVLGMVYDFLPYMVLPIYTIMLKIDRSLV